LCPAPKKNPGLSRTKAIFQDFPGPGKFPKKIQDFPGGVGTLMLIQSHCMAKVNILLLHTAWYELNTNRIKTFVKAPVLTNSKHKSYI